MSAGTYSTDLVTLNKGQSYNQSLVSTLSRTSPGGENKILYASFNNLTVDVNATVIAITGGILVNVDWSLTLNSLPYVKCSLSFARVNQVYKTTTNSIVPRGDLSPGTKDVRQTVYLFGDQNNLITLNVNFLENGISFIFFTLLESGYSFDMPGTGTRSPAPGTRTYSPVADICPWFIIRARTETYMGRELSQCIFSSKEQHSQYLMGFSSYIIKITPSDCTLEDKVLSIANKDYTLSVALRLLTDLVSYGLLKYYLWQLITGVFTLEIMQQRYNTLFLEVLKQSNYSCYYNDVTSLDSMLKYFVY